jgi:hypothetical protein
MKNTIALILILAGPAARAQQNDTLPKADTGQWEQALAEITVQAASSGLTEHVTSAQMGNIDLPVTMLAKVPSIAGEPDVIKALQTTPGVKRGTEGSIGMYVRGGGKDENLILMDGAPVYNAGHLLGFFSVFNTHALKDVQLYKSSFAARYGGRLSSIMDIKTRDGSLQDFKANASLGLIASSLTVQGPLVKDKLSFMVSGRRTYADKVLKFIPYYFFDINSKIMYKAGEENRFYLSTYQGNDVMELEKSGTDSVKGAYTLNSGMKLGNNIISLRWNSRPAHEKYISDITAYYSGFRYRVDGSMGSNTLSMRSAIRDIGLKGDWQWRNTGLHHIRAGFSWAHRYFNPNVVQSGGAALAQFKSGTGKKIHNQEAALYIQDDMSLNEQWQLNAGMRVSGTLVQGKAYVNPEPRLGLRYQLSGQSSLKVSYARMVQYMQLVSSSSLSLPTDLWYPVTATIRPGVSDQLSAGYYHVLPGAGITLSSELYYKKMNNLVEYKEGALLILNDDYEKELLKGKGQAYGIELFAGKTAGRFSGWISYSLAYARRSFDSLNGGAAYFARYDRRHDCSFVGLFEANKRWSFNVVVQYTTGSPFTGQQSQYVVPKPDFSGFDVLPVYTSRNALRLSSSFRIDLDITYHFRIGNKLKGDAHFGAYNLMNRTQPYKVEKVFDDSRKTYVYQQKGLFGIVPSFALNFNL